MICAHSICTRDVETYRKKIPHNELLKAFQLLNRLQYGCPVKNCLQFLSQLLHNYAKYYKYYLKAVFILFPTVICYTGMEKWDSVLIFDTSYP